MPFALHKHLNSELSSGQHYVMQCKMLKMYEMPISEYYDQLEGLHILMLIYLSNTYFTLHKPLEQLESPTEITIAERLLHMHNDSLQLDTWLQRFNHNEIKKTFHIESLQAQLQN